MTPAETMNALTMDESINTSTPIERRIPMEIRTTTPYHCKWQVSDKVGDRIYVLYADSDEEFKEALPKFNNTIEARLKERGEKQAVQQPKSQPLEDNLTAHCPIHGSEMKGKQWDDGGVSYSHLIPNVGWCNGKQIKPLKK